MKKYVLVLLLLFSVVLVWCKKTDISTLDVDTITNIPALQTAITQVTQGINAGTLAVEKAQNLVNQLQQKYLDLTDTAQQSIETEFNTIEKVFETKSITLYTLPLRARRLWMTTPKWMQLEKTLSKIASVNVSGYSSTILVYTWNYIIAMQQAKLIADKAHLFVTKNFQQAQALAKVGNIDYISGLDVSGLAKWIVYVNHELLDTKIANLLSVSVDQDGTLTIETTKTN